MDYEFSNLPLGLAMANLYDNRINTGSRPLTEAQKEELMNEYRDAGSEAEKEKIKDALPPDDDINSLFGGPSIG